MTTPTEALGRLREQADKGVLATWCEGYDLDLLVVHGSVLDPAPLRPPDDLDVAFRGASGSKPDILRVVNDLMQDLSLDKVDLMDLGRAGPVARSRALAPGSELLYEKSPGTFATAQMAALTEAMETRHMRRRDLELLADR